MDSYYFELGDAHVVPTISLHELLETYFAKRIRPHGQSDQNNIKKAFKLLAERFPNIDTSKFDGEHLEEYQRFLNRKEYARTYINKLVGFVKSVIDWGGRKRLVSTRIAWEIEHVPQLKCGDALKENPDREDASREAIAALRPHLPPQIADMMDLLTLSGMRPKEMCDMKVGEIDKNPKGRLSGLGYWLYTPTKHKTQRSGKIRQIPLGEEEQAILEKYLTGKKEDAPVFCNLYRKKEKAMTSATYGRYIKETIDAHGLEKFTAYQLRHAHATWCGEHLDEDHARARLGHASAAMTRKYNHSDIQKQIAVLEKRKAVGSPVGNFATPTPEKPLRPLRIYTGE